MFVYYVVWESRPTKYLILVMFSLDAGVRVHVPKHKQHTKKTGLGSEFNSMRLSWCKERCGGEREKEREREREREKV